MRASSEKGGGGVRFPPPILRLHSETDDDFENKPYILKMPASESAINIQDIISFSKRVDPTPERIRNSIADLSWKKQMERVIAELNL